MSQAQGTAVYDLVERYGLPAPASWMVTTLATIHVVVATEDEYNAWAWRFRDATDIQASELATTSDGEWWLTCTRYLTKHNLQPNTDLEVKWTDKRTVRPGWVR
jgi:hypothetical protein